MTALTFHDVTLSYDRHPAIHHLNGTVPAGSLTAIVGPNGAGKSTLLKAIVGLAENVEGRIDRTSLALRDIAYLPQQAEIDCSFPISVRDAVAIGLWHRSGPFRRLTPGAAAEIGRALDSVGLRGFDRRPVDSLSAGQLQRVLFARMLLQEARLILLDEPFTAIDAKTTADLLAIVKRWHGERRTVLCVLHDLDQVRAHFPNTLLLARHVIAWADTRAALSPANLLRARTMAEARDDSASVCEAAR